MAKLLVVNNRLQFEFLTQSLQIKDAQLYRQQIKLYHLLTIEPSINWPMYDLLFNLNYCCIWYFCIRYYFILYHDVNKLFKKKIKIKIKCLAMTYILTYPRHLAI